jgi:hypothetical protein
MAHVFRGLKKYGDSPDVSQKVVGLAKGVAAGVHHGDLSLTQMHDILEKQRSLQPRDRSPEWDLLGGHAGYKWLHDHPVVKALEVKKMDTWKPPLHLIATAQEVVKQGDVPDVVRYIAGGKVPAYLLQEVVSLVKSFPETMDWNTDYPHWYPALGGNRGAAWAQECIEKFNNCHNPGGEGGGQFCSSGNGKWTDKRSTPTTGAGKPPYLKVRGGALASAIENGGGFTYQPLHGTIPDKGYAVSIYRTFESFRVMPHGVKSLSPEEHTKLRKYLRGYMEKNKEMFRKPDHFFGAWFDPRSGRLYLDISVVKQDKQEALDLAVKHRQEAVFDLGKFESVYTNARGEN